MLSNNRKVVSNDDGDYDDDDDDDDGNKNDVDLQGLLVALDQLVSLVLLVWLDPLERLEILVLSVSLALRVQTAVLETEELQASLVSLGPLELQVSLVSKVPLDLLERRAHWDNLASKDQQVGRHCTICLLYTSPSPRDS